MLFAEWRPLFTTQSEVRESGEGINRTLMPVTIFAWLF
jgi:hypothetical protein